MTQSSLPCSQGAVEYAVGWTTSSAFHLPVAGSFYATDKLERARDVQLAMRQVYV